MLLTLIETVAVIALGLVLIAAVFSFLTPTFLTGANLLNSLQQSSINACIALGMTLVIISGGIDLSVGPVVLTDPRAQHRRLAAFVRQPMDP
jgi:ribose transport system permease protein